MLRPGGTQYCLEEHCGLQEHSTAWEEHATAWMDTVLSGGTLLCTETRYGLEGTHLGLEEHTIAWRTCASCSEELIQIPTVGATKSIRV